MTHGDNTVTAQHLAVPAGGCEWHGAHHAGGTRQWPSDGSGKGRTPINRGALPRGSGGSPSPAAPSLGSLHPHSLAAALRPPGSCRWSRRAPAPGGAGVPVPRSVWTRRHPAVPGPLCLPPRALPASFPFPVSLSPRRSGSGREPSKLLLLHNSPRASSGSRWHPPRQGLRGLVRLVGHPKAVPAPGGCEGQVSRCCTRTGATSQASPDATARFVELEDFSHPQLGALLRLPTDRPRVSHGHQGQGNEISESQEPRASPFCLLLGQMAPSTRWRRAASLGSPRQHVGTQRTGTRRLSPHGPIGSPRLGAGVLGPVLLIEAAWRWTSTRRAQPPGQTATTARDKPWAGLQPAERGAEASPHSRALGRRCQGRSSARRFHCCGEGLLLVEEPPSSPRPDGNPRPAPPVPIPCCGQAFGLQLLLTRPSPPPLSALTCRGGRSGAASAPGQGSPPAFF